MATNYPYVSAQGALVKAFEQFRKQVPNMIDAEVLKKFSIAPANESYVINTFRFLGVIDDNGNRNEAVTDFFYGSDDKFKPGLETLVIEAYKPLFDDHGPDAWSVDKDTLATWFRVSDKTSELVGGRQAKTFQTLAALAGHGEVSQPTSNGSAQPKKKKVAAEKPRSSHSAEAAKGPVAPQLDASRNSRESNQSTDVGLTVRIEVNLPANGTPDVYDAIFSSVRKHLIDRD